MKTLFSLSLAAAACLVSAPRASAIIAVPPTLDIANGTYVFTETDGLNYGCTGSTVTFFNDVLTSWDIVLNAPGAPYYDKDTYTPLNSFIPMDIYQGLVYGPDDFGYNIRANNYDSSGDPLAEIGWSGGAGYIYDNPSWSLGPLDPSGTWTAVPAPDGGLTAGLLGSALIGLATLRRKLVA
jgi:hypothetical protein